jgi:hypothetical protein
MLGVIPNIFCDADAQATYFLYCALDSEAQFFCSKRVSLQDLYCG